MKWIRRMKWINRLMTAYCGAAAGNSYYSHEMNLMAHFVGWAQINAAFTGLWLALAVLFAMRAAWDYARDVVRRDEEHHG